MPVPEISPVAGHPAQHPAGSNPNGHPTPWWVIVGLAMGPAVALGLSRFAYALILPSMRTDLGWNFADAGTMNTVNATGYLIGALMAVPLSKRLGDKHVFGVSLLLTTIAVGMSGMSSDFSVLLMLRLAAGFTGALAFVSGAGLASAVSIGGPKSRAPTFLGIYFSGAGIGITASALTVPPLLGAHGWRGGWLGVGLLSFVATVFGWLAMRRSPTPRDASSTPEPGGWSLRFMSFKLLAYGLFGAGYITYMTFIIAYLQTDRGMTGISITSFWSILGLSSVAAAFIWGPILCRLKGGWGMAATVCIVMLGTVVPLRWNGMAGAYLSAFLFGGSFLSVVTAVTSFARRAAKPHAWAAAIAALTIAFGLGQIIGPLLSGSLSDGPGGVRIGLCLSAGILMVSAFVAVFQPEPGKALLSSQK